MQTRSPDEAEGVELELPRFGGHQQDRPPAVAIVEDTRPGFGFTIEPL